MKRRLTTLADFAHLQVLPSSASPSSPLLSPTSSSGSVPPSLVPLVLALTRFSRSLPPSRRLLPFFRLPLFFSVFSPRLLFMQSRHFFLAPFALCQYHCSNINLSRFDGRAERASRGARRPRKVQLPLAAQCSSTELSSLRCTTKSVEGGRHFVDFFLARPFLSPPAKKQDSETSVRGR
jgi:hypothetical protein